MNCAAFTHADDAEVVRDASGAIGATAPEVLDDKSTHSGALLHASARYVSEGFGGAPYLPKQHLPP